MFERDAARRGFEINILNRQWFIGDNKIHDNKFLKMLFTVVFFHIRIKTKLWYITHKKFLAELKRKANAIEFEQVSEFVQRRKKEGREQTIEIYTESSEYTEKK